MMNPQALDQTLDKSPSAKTSPIGSDTTATPGAPSLQAAARHRRRKLLLMAAPAVLATAVVALKLLSLPLAAGQAAHAYEAGNADGTVRAGQAMGVLNMVERYKSHFAVGMGTCCAETLLRLKRNLPKPWNWYRRRSPARCG
ncbi:hypothetical protein NHF46_12390 [Arthrobacter alpinus]|nr:hypothetical protein [Arthrobacter alpinus]